MSEEKKPRGYPTHRLEPGFAEWLEEQLAREERERDRSEEREER